MKPITILYRCKHCGKVVEREGTSHQEAQAKMKPVTSLYRCKHCGKTVEREGTKQWRKSFCEQTGKNARITRINLQPSNQPASST